MRRFIFCNMQGLSNEPLSLRLAVLAQLLIEVDVDIALLCEVMLSSSELETTPMPKKARFSSRKLKESQSQFGEKYATSLAHNSALEELVFSYLRSYPEERYDSKHREGSQKGYGILSKSTPKTTLCASMFGKSSTRAPLYWRTRDGVHVYMIHAISNHGAARKQLELMIELLAKRHGKEAWMIVGDLNCPPWFLTRSKTNKLYDGKPQIIPFKGVYLCIPEGPTRRKSGNLLDYVISNIPCRVCRLPTKHVETRSTVDIAELLDKANLDHCPILVEYTALGPGKSSFIEKMKSKSSSKDSDGFVRPTLPSSLRRVPILGDGNCLFRAIGYHTRDDHEQLRALAVNHVLTHWDTYQGFIGSEHYIADLAGDGVWAGHVALVALAEELDLHIRVYRFDGDVVNINPGGARLIHLYYTGDHYDAAVPARRRGRIHSVPPRLRKPMSVERFIVTTVHSEIRRVMKRSPKKGELEVVLGFVTRKLIELGALRRIKLMGLDSNYKLERLLRYLVRRAFDKMPMTLFDDL